MGKRCESTLCLVLSPSGSAAVHGPHVPARTIWRLSDSDDHQVCDFLVISLYLRPRVTHRGCTHFGHCISTWMADFCQRTPRVLQVQVLLHRCRVHVLYGQRAECQIIARVCDFDSFWCQQLTWIIRDSLCLRQRVSQIFLLLPQKRTIALPFPRARNKVKYGKYSSRYTVWPLYAHC